MKPKEYITLALDLAKKAWGQTAPNPMVGAVLVKDGIIIACGYHKKAGLAHAEVDCIKNCIESGNSPEGATMYVSLEPCSTIGKTGACTQAIIKAKIKKVIAATADLNPDNANRAGEIFAKNNVIYESGICQKQAKNLNFIFEHNVIKNEALLAIKYAITKDGKIAKTAGKPSKITGKIARENVMLWRKLFDCICIGSGTLLSDNPSLTIRLGNSIESKYRFVMDRSLKLADYDDLLGLKMFSDEFKDKTYIVCTTFSDRQKLQKLKDMGLNVLEIKSDKNESFWQIFKETLYRKMNISSVYVEGGAKMFESILFQQKADFAFEYKAPKIFGKNALSAFINKKNFKIKSSELIKLGKDTLKMGKVIYK